MAKREPFKFVTIADRKWRVGRFDALTGSYIAFTVMTKMLPMIAELMGGKAAGEPDVNALAAGMMNSRATLSREDFLSLQKDCLMVCSEVKEVAGVDAPLPVLLTSGAWGVADLEHDVSSVLALTVHALFFNISSFFEGDALKGMMAGLKDQSLFSAKE
jgi:hypothetical protein